MLYVACAFLFDLRTAIYSVIYTVFCALFIDRGHQQNINVSKKPRPRSRQARYSTGILMRK